MSPKNRVCVLALLLVAGAASACSTATRQEVREDVRKAATRQPTWKQYPSTNHPRKNVTVQFTDANLHPSIARVTSGGSVGWVNYSSMAGSVVFPRSFPDSLTCGQPRPQFGEVAKGYQSEPVTAGGAEGVMLPCPLKPGEYEYEIYLYQGQVDAMSAGMLAPLTTMQGKIIAE